MTLPVRKASLFYWEPTPVKECSHICAQISLLPHLGGVFSHFSSVGESCRVDLQAGKNDFLP